MTSWKWILLIALVSQVFLYAARVPMHRALRNLGQALGDGLRLAGRWCRDAAQDLSRRSQELVLESGRDASRHRVDRELRRIEGTFAKDLARFPHLHRRLDDLVGKLEADYRECGDSPPPSPQWGELVKSLAALPPAGDKMAGRVLGDFHKAAVAGEKKAFEEHRTATARRHRILGAMVPRWKDVKSLTAEVGRSCERALGATTRIDGYMERYEQILRGKTAAKRILTWSTINSFVIAALVMAVALGGAFINFQLIALPMSELVPAGSRLMGVPVPSIAALVLVLMEVAAGLFLLEMLGITSLFPHLGHLSTAKRNTILAVAFTGLLLLAGIESSLAILREQIVEAESALKQTLGGVTDAAVRGPAESMIPLVGQAVLGFILPWILAMVAIPLEMLISTAGPVMLMLLGLVFTVVGSVLRLAGHVTRGLAAAVTGLYDVTIVVPLQIERIARARRTEARREERPDDPVPGAVAAGSGEDPARPGAVPVPDPGEALYDRDPLFPRERAPRNPTESTRESEVWS
jgi:hypothetical protein